MTLNTEEKTIAFQHNEKDLGVADRNLDFSDNKLYHMAVFVGNAKTSIKLIDMLFVNRMHGLIASLF